MPVKLHVDVEFANLQTGQTIKIGEARGRWTTITGDLPLFFTLHPSTILRTADKRARSNTRELFKRDIKRDIKRAFAGKGVDLEWERFFICREDLPVSVIYTTGCLCSESRCLSIITPRGRDFVLHLLVSENHHIRPTA